VKERNNQQPHSTVYWRNELINRSCNHWWHSKIMCDQLILLLFCVASFFSDCRIGTTHTCGVLL